MKVVSHYVDPASGIDYVTSIDDYFLFLRYWNMNSFLYFWMAFYTIFFYRFEIKENGLLLNTSYTFMLTFLWQIVLELCSLFLPLKAITTYHDLGDELISQTGMTLLGVATFIHLNHYIKIPVIKSTNARYFLCLEFSCIMFLYICHALILSILFFHRVIFSYIKTVDEF